MGIKADFYIGYLPNADWIGSVYDNGSIWTIPSNILVQNDPELYELAVLEFLKNNKSVIKGNNQSWPWEWFDSRETDYSYLYILEKNKVAISVNGEIIVDPISILRGNDMVESDLGIGKPIFPIMRLPYIETLEDITKYCERILN